MAMRGERPLARVVDLVPQSDVVVDDDGGGQVAEEPQDGSPADQTSTGVSHYQKYEHEI